MAKTKPVRIGMMGYAHLDAGNYADCVNQTDGTVLVGIADDDGPRARAAATEHGTKVYSSHAKLLSAGVDAVIVCSENAKHKNHVLMAAAAGKHVFCEKPLATTIDDARAMISICEASGVSLQVSAPCRFSPSSRSARESVKDGKVGRVLAMKGTNRGKCPGGWYERYSLSGGGAVMDYVVHVVDLMRWITGAEPVEVYAELDSLMVNRRMEDCATVSVRFSNGTVASIDPSWSRPQSYPYWGDVTLAVIGTEGSVRLDLFGGQKMDHYSDGTMRHEFQQWGDDLSLLQIRSFVDAIANSKPVEVSGEDGLAALAVAVGAYQSAKNTVPVKLADIGF